MNTLAYQLWDVFTDVPFAGNQLAVVAHGESIAAGSMQQIANEFALPETVFVLPARERGCTHRLRIFTPRRELPMAGHPTIGAIFALARGGAFAPGTAQIRLELGIGPTAIDLEWHGETLACAWMTQPAPEFGPACVDTDLLGRVLGLEAAALAATGAPVQVVSSGVPLLFVCLGSRAEVDRAALDRSALVQLVSTLGVPECPVYVFTLEAGDDGALTYSRMFAPAFGIAEDPATGGAGGPLLGFVARYFPQVLRGDGPYLNRQGVSLGRPASIRLRRRARDGDGEDVQVGGTAVPVGEGSLRVPTDTRSPS